MKAYGGSWEPRSMASLRHAVEVGQQALAVARGRFQEGAGGHQLVLDDVPQPPPAPRPGRREVRLPLVLWQSLDAAAQLARLDVHRRGDVGARHLGQQTRDVLPPRRVAGAARPVAVENHVAAHAELAGLLEPHAHHRAQQVGLAEDQGVDLRRQRIGLRRHEHPRAGGAHLVLVDEDLREPAMVEQLVDRLRLLLRQHVEVAVVVVPDVDVVEPGHRPGFVRRSQVLAGTSRPPSPGRPG